MLSQTQRYQGCLLGLAAGDAVGTTVEFKPRGSFTPLTDMVGGGPFGLKPGQWTDDTSMALCLAYSLIECQGFDANDQIQRYNQWRTQGYLSSTGRCFDIGSTVSEAISQYLATGEPFSGSTNPFAAGNGSIMRLAPVVIYYSKDPQEAIRQAIQSSRTTHGAKECLDACGYLAAILLAAFAGEDKQAILATDTFQASTKKIKQIQQQSYFQKTREQISGSGYVVSSLEAALWCFYQTDNFADAILMAANLGDDADTTAAVCGQIAGAYYGVDAIPSSWREKLTMFSEIAALAIKLSES